MCWFLNCALIASLVVLRSFGLEDVGTMVSKNNVLSLNRIESRNKNVGIKKAGNLTPKNLKPETNYPFCLRDFSND